MRSFAALMPTAILFYDVVLSIHVMAIVAAFGVWFAYPLLVARGDAGAHRAQVRVARTVVDAGGDARPAGRRLHGQRPLVLERGVGQRPAGHPRRADGDHRRLLRPAPGAPRRAGRGGAGPEYAALATQVARVAFLAAGLVVVAIFFMVAKP